MLVYILFTMGSFQLAFAQNGALVVTDAWARPVIIMGRPGAAYLTIHNGTERDDTLLKASSSLADHIELHVHKHDNGIMTMEQVKDIAAPAHHVTVIEPGGFHLMIFGLTKKLAKGDALPLTLVFKNAGEIHVMAKVMKKPPQMDMLMDSHMDHSKMNHGMGQ